MTTTRDDQPIVAQCTPQGAGAIALIRVSGTNSIELVDRVARLASKKTLSHSQSHTIHYGSVVAGEELIDTVLFLLMKAPRTFTGEDTVEITS